jgi:hypothetical protein
MPLLDSAGQGWSMFDLVCAVSREMTVGERVVALETGTGAD